MRANRRNPLLSPSEPGEDFIYLLDEMDAGYHLLTMGQSFYFQTDNQADNGRLIAIHLNNRPASWQALIAEGNDAITLSA
ncbi:MAG: hypothetical protein H6656_10195 [Ardenticatenaceae bacterium]|nr:hypothetical protein [Ardenticatenaceae bacterium]